MAKTITIAGNTYPDVPYIVVPAAAGGTTAFRHCTGTIDIYDNGLTSVAGYENAYVNVEGGGGGIPEVDLIYMLQSGDIPEELTQAFTESDTPCIKSAGDFYVEMEDGSLFTVGGWEEIIVSMDDDSTLKIVTSDGYYVYMPVPCEYEERPVNEPDLNETVFTDYYASNYGYDANTEDATATESDILLGKTAYVNGAKLEGTYEADVPFAYGGMNAVKVAEYSETFTLADTSFVIGSSASTSATSIKATVSNRFTSDTIAINDKDIVVVQTVKAQPTHGSSSTAKARQVNHAACHVTYISKRTTSATSGKTTRHPAPFSTAIIQYYNSSGTLTRAGANYGFYSTPQQATVSSTTAASATVRASSPILYYRASSSYESTTNIKLVNACVWQWNVEVYLVDPFTSVCSAANDKIHSLIT